MQFTRRRLLKLSAASGAVVASSMMLDGCDWFSLPDKVIAEHLVSLLASPEKANALGQQFIDQSSSLQSQTLESLTRQILAKIDAKRRKLTLETLMDLNDPLQERVQKDFKQELVTIHQGWMLSNTEVEVCALLTILKQTSA